MDFETICVLGLGYIGLPTASTFATHGVRAALCGDAETARGARLWNDANVLCLSLRHLSEAVAKEILETWFATAYVPNPEDDACLSDLEEIEQKYSQ